MREIKFRGKRIDNGEWVYGYLLVTQMSGVYIIGTKTKSKSHKIGGEVASVSMGDVIWQHEVDLATVGQYTGLKDKNGREIWEGDIIHNGYGDFGVIKIGEFIDHNLEDKESNADCSIYGVYIEYSDGTYFFDTVYTPEWVEVIGNIHDNPLEVTP